MLWNMTHLALSFTVLCALLVTLHVISAAVTIAKCRHRPARGTLAQCALRVSIVRPVCGLEAAERLTLASTFRLDLPRAELLFCCRAPDDPAIPYLQSLIDAHPLIDARILVGDDLGSDNPKLNNMTKGWRAATGDWIIFADSNLDLPRDYITRVLAAWQRDTGVVCAPPIGSAPIGFWAEVECGFLNTYQARWQYTAEAVGLGFAQGKTMLWRRADLDTWGGTAALARDLAEDAAATKLVRSNGHKVRLASPPFMQPLGYRTASQVIGRQLRWAQLRRLSFPAFFIPEILTGMVPMAAAGATAAALMDGEPILAGALLCALWLSTEAIMAWSLGWRLSWQSPLAWIVRDFLLPVIWARAWIADGYAWRGNSVSARASRGLVASLTRRASAT
jgi:ceramide glucosyltransferase